MNFHRQFIKSPYFKALIIFSLALVVRMGLVLYLQPQIKNIWDDEVTYLRMSQGFWVPNHMLFLWPEVMFWTENIFPFPNSIHFVMCFISSLSAGIVFLIAYKNFCLPAAWAAGIIHACFGEVAFFSHYLFAEPLLELFIVSATFFLFDRQKPSENIRYLAFGFILLGIGFLCKHFVILPYGAFTLIFFKFIRERMAVFSLLSLLFFSFPVYLSFKTAREMEDPYYVFHNLLKDMKEWRYNRFTAGFQPGEREAGLKNHLSYLKTLTMADVLWKFRFQYRHLWQRNNFVHDRLHSSYYKNLYGASYLDSYMFIYYIFALALGVLGWFYAELSDFLVYSILNILFLSLMGLFVTLVARFRVPFLFLFSIYAGRFLVEFKTSIRKIKSSWQWGRLSLAAGLHMALFYF